VATTEQGDRSRRGDAPPQPRTFRRDVQTAGRGVRRIGGFIRRRHRPIILCLVALGAGGALGYVSRGVAGLQLDVAAPAQDVHVQPDAVTALRFRVTAVHHPEVMKDAELTLDGHDVKEKATIAGGVLTYRPPRLRPGPHRLHLSVRQPSAPWAATRTWHFVVDRQPPRLRILGTPLQVRALSPLTVHGVVSPGTTLTVVGGARVPVLGGRFTLHLSTPPLTPLILKATDQAGNVTLARVAPRVIPRRPPERVRAVHMTAISWAVPSLRNPVLRMIDRGQIDSVEIDLKDESGVVGYNSRLALPRRIGAVQPEYDLQKVVRLLHSKGVWVIGRIVAFRDPVLARWAWRVGRRDQVIQTPDGQPYKGYGGFTNFSSRAVQDYNISIAKEAAAAGVDDILYDYVRRPDGPLTAMRFPGLKESPERAVTRFTARSREALRPWGTFLGASLFGVSANRPREVAQNVAGIARTVDYVAPLVYPSHWSRGEYDVPDPDAEPYLIVKRSLADFQRQVRGTGARVVPWLQDFSLGVHYGPAEVRAQIRAARDLGIREFIMWDAGVTYTSAAYAPR
jgi:hypothetical protein